jgi:hypothetical protein
MASPAAAPSLRWHLLESAHLLYLAKVTVGPASRFIEQKSFKRFWQLVDGEPALEREPGREEKADRQGCGRRCQLARVHRATKASMYSQGPYPKEDKAAVMRVLPPAIAAMRAGPTKDAPKGQSNQGAAAKPQSAGRLVQ